MKERIVPFVIFMIFLVAGLGLRLLWFYTFQKKIVEDRYFYKELKEDQGGAKIPQEAWNKYLDALEKEDIEEALLYVWPDERGKYVYLYKLKESNFLSQYARNYGRDLRENRKIQLGEDELAFYYDYISDKKIEILLAPEDLKNIIIKDWEAKSLDKEKVIFTAIFKYNPHNKKWYIK